MSAIVWSTDNCTFCDQAKALLEQRNIAYEEKKIGNGYTQEQLLAAVPAAKTVPQIFVNKNYIGGFTELRRYIEETAGGYGE
jgi:glutaredoxin